MRSAPWPTEGDPDPGVLGRLLIAQATLHALPSPTSIAQFLCRALSSVPGVVGIEMSDTHGVLGSADLAGDPAAGAVRHAYPVDTIGHSYGSLAVTVTDPAAFQPYEPHIRNLASVVAMSLENRDQRERLAATNADLRTEVVVQATSHASLVEALTLLEGTIAARTLELQETEGRLRLAQKEARIGTWDWDLAGGTMRLSDRQLALFALDRPDGAVPVERLWDAVHPDDTQRLRAAFEATSRGDDMSIQFRVGRPDGDERWLAVHGWAAPDPDGCVRRVIGITIDVTERKRMENDLLQAQKLESIGRLAGGVAHDFNNLLTAIIGFTELAAMELPGHPAAEYLDEIRASSQRAADLTRQLLAFARRQTTEPQVVDPNALIGSTAAMLRRLIGEHVELRTDLDPDVGHVLIDPGQLTQVLVNLTVNARDAMPDGGTVVVATRGGRPGAGGEPPFVPAIDLVHIDVRDGGRGMPEAVKARIFEPFFTTKDTGSGTGLGLASAYGIITQAGGRIDVESEVDRGSTFTITLPRVPPGASRGRARAASGDPRGAETILLAEDDPVLRRLAARALRSYGYAVLEAGDGLQALELAAAHPGPVDVLVTDVVMPVMGGMDLLGALRLARPHIPAILVSGYTDGDVQANGPTATAFVAKPYALGELAAAIRRLVDSPEGPPEGR